MENPANFPALIIVLYSVISEHSINISTVEPLFLQIPAICADGSYYKYSFNSKGETRRESYFKFLHMTDD